MRPNISETVNSTFIATTEGLTLEIIDTKLGKEFGSCEIDVAVIEVVIGTVQLGIGVVVAGDTVNSSVVCLFPEIVIKLHPAENIVETKSIIPIK
jgi:hypothetical protein